MTDTSEKLTPKKAAEWRPVFLATLRNTANVRASCQVAGVTRQVAYVHRNNSTEFAAQWDDALQDAVDALEAVAINRARTSSDTLLIFLLKAHRPKLYRETNRSVVINLTPEQAAAMSDADIDAALKGFGL